MKIRVEKRICGAGKMSDEKQRRNRERNKERGNRKKPMKEQEIHK